MRALMSLALCCVVSFASPAFGCSSPAAYRSVVVNVAPPQIPQGAVLLKVQVQSGLYSAQLRDVQGLRGQILLVQAGATAETQFEIVTRLGSMCNTWVEVWSSDHDATDGVLTGYIAGYPIGVRDGYLIIEPLLYQAFAYRDPDPAPGQGHLPDGGNRQRLDPNAEWHPFRIDAEALAGNLEATNAQIRADLERRGQE